MTPRPAATLIVLRPRGPQVLMLKRPLRGVFGGMWVFPGGSLEPIDEGDLARRVVAVPAHAEDRAARSAALRETVEEVGLAVTDPPLDDPLDGTGEEVFEGVRSRGVVLDGRRLQFLSRWVTPRDMSVRFDTRFYLTTVERPPRLLPRAGEVVDLAWVTAAEAMARSRSGEWSLARPTLHHLEWLDRYDDVDEIWRAAGAVSGDTDASRLQADGSEVPVSFPAVPHLP